MTICRVDSSAGYDFVVIRSVSIRRSNGTLTVWGAVSASEAWTSSAINVGTLVLDLYDPSTKQLVWSGNATKTIDPSSNQEKSRK